MPGLKLTGGISCIRKSEGWIYLATVIDLCSKELIVWAIAPHMRTSLVTDALSMAHDRGLTAGNAIMHTDGGGQYSAKDYQRLLGRLGIAGMLIAAVLTGIGTGMITPLRCAALAVSADPEQIGTTMGAAELGRELGDAVGPLLVGAAALAVGLGAGLKALAALTALALPFTRRTALRGSHPAHGAPDPARRRHSADPGLGGRLPAQVDDQEDRAAQRHRDHEHGRAGQGHSENELRRGNQRPFRPSVPLIAWPLTVGYVSRR
ncbi:DDE-type integrase/transposase/recombinase [Actinospica durhamensis]|uniref:DDE-type integrase/transposase/recombinase n=1 Tax=Actinospica durhamensis TaxID=1508375 RepID=A0A941ISW1_9ACTN|nr:MFS transporter [Actinospica durhamensis]MBR7838994.1 DDE-type integrase/transposase/recombinase [Actinospica durhamensis]